MCCCFLTFLSSCSLIQKAKSPIYSSTCCYLLFASKHAFDHHHYHRHHHHHHHSFYNDDLIEDNDFNYVNPVSFFNLHMCIFLFFEFLAFSLCWTFFSLDLLCFSRKLQSSDIYIYIHVRVCVWACLTYIFLRFLHAFVCMMMSSCYIINISYEHADDDKQTKQNILSTSFVSFEHRNDGRFSSLEKCPSTAMQSEPSPVAFLLADVWRAIIRMTGTHLETELCPHTLEYHDINSALNS